MMISLLKRVLKALRYISENSKNKTQRKREDKIYYLLIIILFIVAIIFIAFLIGASSTSNLQISTFSWSYNFLEWTLIFFSVLVYGLTGLILYKQVREQKDFRAFDLDLRISSINPEIVSIPQTTNLCTIKQDKIKFMRHDDGELYKVNKIVPYGKGEFRQIQFDTSIQYNQEYLEANQDHYQIHFYHTFKNTKNQGHALFGIYMFAFDNNANGICYPLRGIDAQRGLLLNDWIHVFPNYAYPGHYHFPQQFANVTYDDFNKMVFDNITKFEDGIYRLMLLYISLYDNEKHYYQQINSYRIMWDLYYFDFWRCDYMPLSFIPDYLIKVSPNELKKALDIYQR